MTYKSKTKIILSALFIAGCFFSANAQTNKATVKAVAYDGYIAAGYVDNGAFINFGGPAVKLVNKPYFVSLGMVPSLKIKKDKVAEGAPENSIVTPTLGFALSFGYKHLVVQVPFYYSAKIAATAAKAASNGKWMPGIGVGYKF